MKVIVICFLCLFYSASARVYLIQPTCTAIECELYLMRYVNKMNSRVVSEEDKTTGRLVFTISHPKPFTDTAGLYARAFTVTRERIEIQDFKSSENATGLYLHAGLELTDIEDARRCKVLSSDLDYFNRECQISIDYYDTLQHDVIKSLIFHLTVRIPRRVDMEFKAFEAKFPDHGCNYIIDMRLTFQTRIFRSDCITPMSLGESFIYGEELCFAIFGNDPISSSSEYEIESLTVLYQKSMGIIERLDILGLSIIRCSLANNICAKGQVFIRVPMIFVGNIKFSAVVVLKDLRRVLSEDCEAKAKGGIIDIPGRFEIDQDYGRFIDDDTSTNDDESFGYSLAVSMSILIGLLIVII